MKKIKVGGREYPCRITMGALLRYKRQTGHDVSQIDGTNLEDIVSFMFACTESACSADKVSFDMTFEEFCDNITPDDMTSFADSEMVGAECQKKRIK